MRCTLKRWVLDKGGNVSLIFALVLPALLGIAGLAIETGYWYSEKKRIQIASDVAAYSAVVAYAVDGDRDRALKLATKQARASGFDGADTDLQIVIPAPDGDLGAYSAKASISQEVPLFLSKLFLHVPVGVAVQSYASVDKKEAPPCVVALNGIQTRSIVIASGVQVEMTDCVLASNSRANDAIWLEGTARLTADCISTPGTVGNNGGSGLTLTTCTRTNYPKETATDYLAGTPFPGQAGAPDCPGPVDLNVAQSEYGSRGRAGDRLRPCKYSKNVAINGTVNLDPGIYYFTSGFQASPNSKIIGENVTLYFDGNVAVPENVQWQISAPTTGPTKGVALMGNPANTGGQVRLIGIIGNVQGAVYFPKQTVQTESGINGPIPVCTQIIADIVDFRGNGTIRNGCSGASAGAGSTGKVRLVPGPGESSLL